MPLFECAKCGNIENTALSLGSWHNHRTGKPMICSACANPNGWHGNFKERKATDHDRFNGSLQWIMYNGKQIQIFVEDAVRFYLENHPQFKED